MSTSRWQACCCHSLSATYCESRDTRTGWASWVFVWANSVYIDLLFCGLMLFSMNSIPTASLTSPFHLDLLCPAHFSLIIKALNFHCNCKWFQASRQLFGFWVTATGVTAMQCGQCAQCWQSNVTLHSQSKLNLARTHSTSHLCWTNGACSTNLACFRQIS